MGGNLDRPPPAGREAATYRDGWIELVWRRECQLPWFPANANRKSIPHNLQCPFKGGKTLSIHANPLYSPVRCQIMTPGSTPPARPGAPPSRSTLSTPVLPSLLSRTKFPKYLLATSLSCLTVRVSSLVLPSSSTLACSPVRRVSAG